VEVTIGSRSQERADAAVDEIRKAWPDHQLTLQGGENPAAASAELVVVATPWDGAAPTAASLAKELDGKVVISMVNALSMIGGEFQPLILPRGSMAEHIQAALPGSLVAGAFHHLPARELGKIDHQLEADVLVCADHPDAMAATSALTVRMPGLRPLDAGSLSNAMALEAMTTVLLQLNKRYKTRAALRITGVNVPSGD
jgi:NADPH-dependent F420 reductase